MGLLKSNFQLQSAAKLVETLFTLSGLSNILQTLKKENTVNDLINAHLQIYASYVFNAPSMLLKSY